MRSPDTRHCPACARATAQDFVLHKNGCDIYRCRDCGLGRADTTGFDPAAYYTAEYFDGSHADGYADYRGAEPVLRREFRGTVALVRRFVPAGRLLDVGCAYGFLLQEAAPYFEVAGIELADEAAAHARAQGLDVVTGVADAPTLDKLGMFDAITMLDVIEHLPEPDETVALLAHHLNPGGVLVITTGDFGSALARRMGASWRLMTPPQHLWYFTRASIERLAGRLGLSVERFEHPWKVVPLSLMAFQLRRMLKLAPRPPAAPSRIGLPVNLFDALRVVLRKPRAA